MKDAKGHGSESRGGSSKGATDATRRAFTQKFGATGGTMASRGGPSSPDVKANIQKAAQLAKTLGADHPSVGAALHDAVMAARPPGGFYQIGGGQPVASNAHAAATLAGGPKSAPVATHSAMTPEQRQRDFELNGDRY